LADNAVQLDKTDCSAVEIYRKHGAFIRRVIRAHIRDECEADDIFQDFFLNLVANPLPDGIMYMEAYLYRAVMNCIVDTARDTKRYRGHLNRYAWHAKHIRTETPPESPVINAEETKKMFAIIEQCLPKRHAVAVIERYRDDFDVREAAKAKGMNSKSVSRYVSVGLQKIQRILTVGEGNKV
jgi:RNA polymerase sigma factor (sigma-70 family)